VSGQQQDGTQGGREASSLSKRPVGEVLQAHTDNLLAVPGVVGIAEGLCDGQPCIKVFVARKTPDLLKAIPASVEGYPVAVEETGEFRPHQPPGR
jgi:hypothetical protein